MCLQQVFTEGVAGLGKPKTIFDAIAQWNKTKSKEDLEAMKNFRPRRGGARCRELPGTAGKVEFLANRVREGLSLWHSEDIANADGDRLRDLDELSMGRLVQHK